MRSDGDERGVLMQGLYTGGFGGTEALEQGGDAAQERREQGYGGERDMDRSIGA